MDKDSTLKSVGSAGLAVIEKFWEAHWIMRLAQAVLFADLLLIYATGNGLLDLSISGEQILGNTGLLLVCLLGFGLLSSIFFPFFDAFIPWCLNVFFVLFLLPSYISIKQRFMRETSSVSFDRRNFGYVTHNELLDVALEEKDSFLMDLYNDERKKKKEAERETDRVQNLVSQVTLPVIVLSVIDYVLPYLPSGDSVIREMIAVPGEVGDTIRLMLMLCAFLALWAMKWSWFSRPNDGMHWIYYPPLFRQIEEKRRENARRR